MSADVRRKRFEEARRTNTTGFEGAIDGQGRVELVHWSHGAIDRTEPKRWTDRIASRAERNRKGYSPDRTYFGISSALSDGYRKETGLDNNKRVIEGPQSRYKLF